MTSVPSDNEVTLAAYEQAAEKFRACICFNLPLCQAQFVISMAAKWCAQFV